MNEKKLLQADRKYHRDYNKLGLKFMAVMVSQEHLVYVFQPTPCHFLVT